MSEDEKGVITAPQQPIVVQMVQPQSGEPTEGISEITPMGRYYITQPDGGKKLVDAHGQAIKGK